MTGLDIARREAVTEAEVDDYIEMHRPPNCSQPQFSRDFWREQAEADQQYRAQVAAKAQAKTTEAAEIEQLRRRVATLEKGLLTEGGWF
jgi:regulator of protease activity HflC (stomatin/prohibitin superfamily)